MAKLIYEHDDGRQTVVDIQSNLIRDLDALSNKTAFEQILKVFQAEALHPGSYHGS